MPMYEITGSSINKLEPTRLAEHGIQERAHLQKLLKESIDIIAPGCMVLAEEFCEWEDSKRRIDLLCLDEDANLVVIELKRGEEGGHMELQALRYAAMVAPMTYATAVAVHAEYAGISRAEAEKGILEHLGWDKPDESRFGQDVKIVLASGNFSSELTTTVLWLIERGIDARCVRLGPHKTSDGRVILEVAQIIPPPGTDGLQVKLRNKAAEVREALTEKGTWTGWFFANIGEERESKNGRCWEDSRRYGYISAGGGERWVKEIQQLAPGDRIFAYVNRAGYVGAGTVLAAAVLRKDFIVTALGKRLLDLPMTWPPGPENPDPERAEWCAAVRWDASVDRDKAIPGMQRRQSVCRFKDGPLAQRLMKQLGLPVEASE